MELDSHSWLIAPLMAIILLASKFCEKFQIQKLASPTENQFYFKTYWALSDYKRPPFSMRDKIQR